MTPGLAYLLGMITMLVITLVGLGCLLAQQKATPMPPHKTMGPR